MEQAKAGRTRHRRRAFFLLCGFLYGSSWAAGGELVLCDFEAPASMKVIEGRKKVALVAEHAAQGKRAGKVPPGFTLVTGNWTGLPRDWSAYDQLRLDVFNPGATATVSLWIADGKGSDYWKRHNNRLPLRSGANTLVIPVGGLYRGEKGSGKILNPKDIRQLVMSFPKKGAEAFYLDNFRLTKGAGKVQKRLLVGFEEGETPGAKWRVEDWPKSKPGTSVKTFVPEHATQGARALKLQFRKNGGNIALFQFANPDWSRFDSLEIDCFSTAGGPVKISGWFRDEVAKPADGDYWKRHNYQTNVRPGSSAIRFPLGGFYRGEKGSGKFLDLKRMHSFCIAARGVTFFLDNIRLVKGSEEVAVQGLQKFDFGPKGSPNFPGFHAVHPDTAFNAQRGYGWTGGAPSDARNYEQPDSLICDFIRCGNGGQTFSVKLLNGSYRVAVWLDAPGYWDFMYWGKRSIEAEGKTVFQETRSAGEFLKNGYFRFQDTEDLPGTDIWKRYVQGRCPAKHFEVTVADGRLDLRFRGDTWGLTPCALAIYPAAEKETGQRWLDQLDARRREAFYTSYAEVVRKADPKPKLSAGEKASGFVLFGRDPARVVSYNSAPGADASDTREIKFAWAACPNEYESASFSVYPLKDCGRLSLAAGKLSGPGGKEIPASAFRVRAIRYKFKRIGGRITSSFDYRPWLLVDFKEWPVPAGVTRRFWITLHVPPDAAPGTYRGQLTLSLAGKERRIPVSLEVYPFKLDEPRMSIAMYGGSGPTGGAYWPAEVRKQFRAEERIEEVLRDQKEHGMTAVTPPAPRLRGFQNGKAQFNYAQADRMMARLRKLGFDHECFTYASMFRVRQGDAEAASRKQYGLPLQQAIKLAYTELGAHMKAKHWLPMAWALADEPLIHGVSPETVIKVFTAHRKAAPRMQFVSEDAMGDPRHWKVIPAIDIICANTPRYKVAAAVKKAGSRYWFNNIGTDRITFGWFLWKAHLEMGVEALFQWGYSTNKADIYYDLDGSEGDSGISFTASEGQRARREWELIREGAADHRYLQTLYNLIAKAEKSGPAAAKAKAKEARAFCREVMAKIDLEHKSRKPYTGAQLDGFKRKLASFIGALRQAH